MARTVDKTPLKGTFGNVKMVGRLKIKPDAFKGQMMQIGTETFNGILTSEHSSWKRVGINIGIDVGTHVEFGQLSQGLFPENINEEYAPTEEERAQGMKDKRILFRFKNRDEAGNNYDDEVLFKDRHTVKMENVFGNSVRIFRLTRDENNELVTNKFFHLFDCYSYLKENLRDGLEVEVLGRYTHNFYKGEPSTSFEIQSIMIPYTQKETVDGVEVIKPIKYGVFAQQQVVIDKDAYEPLNVAKIVKNNMQMTVDAKVISYVGKVGKTEIKKNLLFPFPFVIKFENEEDIRAKKEIYDYLFKVGRNDVRLLSVNLEASGGVVEQEIDMDALDPQVLALYKMNIISKENLVGRTIRGNAKRTLEFKSPVIIKDDNGAPTILMSEPYKSHDLEIELPQAFHDALEAQKNYQGQEKSKPAPQTTVTTNPQAASIAQAFGGSSAMTDNPFGNMFGSHVISDDDMPV